MSTFILYGRPLVVRLIIDICICGRAMRVPTTKKGRHKAVLIILFFHSVEVELIKVDSFGLVTVMDSQCRTLFYVVCAP